MKHLLLLFLLAAVVAGCKKDAMDGWNGPVIPVSLVDIEAVNIDNSGEFPAISASPIKKEAYMIGICWITEHTPSDDDHIFITGPIQKGARLYSSLSDPYRKAVKCNTPFNAGIPAGKYISDFFKEIDRNYLPAGIDEGFVLLVAPDPGEHSFRIEYYEADGTTLAFFHDTPIIHFY